MSNHTPGPWMFECEDVGTYGSHFWLESEAGEEIICQSENAHQGVLAKGEDFVANARLIAAAPELLEALEGLLNALPSATSHPAIKKARAALAKAKGETE